MIGLPIGLLFVNAGEKGLHRDVNYGLRGDVFLKICYFDVNFVDPDRDLGEVVNTLVARSRVVGRVRSGINDGYGSLRNRGARGIGDSSSNGTRILLCDHA